MGNNSRRPTPKWDPVKKVWIARKTFIDDTGKRRNRRREFPKKADAEDYITGVTSAVKDGRATREVRAQKETVEQYLARWLRETAKPRVRLSTFETYERFVGYYVLPTLGKVAIGKLTPEHFKKLYADLTEQGLGGHTVRHVHMIVRSAFRQAVDDELIPRSPVRNLTLPKIESRRKLAMTVEQARQFIEAAKGNRYEALFILALTTGMRAAELAGLKWADVDQARGEVHVRQTIYRSQNGGWYWAAPKTESGYRTIPVAGWVFDSLERHRAAQDEQRALMGSRWRDNGLVFPDEQGEPIWKQNFAARHLKAILRKAGLDEGFSLRACRRTFITLAIASGNDPKTVAELAGHADVSVTLEVYTQVHQSMREAVRDTLGGLLNPSKD